jgi:hypothetical protein
MSKYNYLVVFLVSLFTIGTLSTNAQEVNGYDFSERKPDSIFSVRHNQMATYQIKNINRFIYDVTINGSLISYNTAVPAVFDQIFKTEAVGNSEIADAANSAVQASDDVSKLKVLESKLQTKHNEIDLFNKLSPPDAFKTLGFTEAPLDSMSFDNYTKFMANLNSELDSLETVYSSQMYSLKGYELKLQNVTGASLKVDQLFDALEKSKVLKNAIVTIAQSNVLDSTKASKQLADLEEQISATINLLSIKSSFEEAISDFNTKHQEYLANSDVQEKFKHEAQEVIASVKKLKEEVDRINALTKKSDYIKIAQDIKVLKSELLNPNSYIAVSNPIQAKEDEVKFDIKITPKSTVNANLLTTTTNFTTQIPVSGGVKIDFSTGLICNIGLNDAKYSSSIAEDSTSFSLSKDRNNNQLGLSLGAFMHFYKKNEKNHHWAGTFGLGLNSTDLNDLEVYFGASKIFGKQERVILSGGLAISKVAYLKGSLDEDVQIDYAKFTDEFTEKAFRVGGFLSFSYNLSR